MAFLDCFADEMTTNVKITGLGVMGQPGIDGQPTYGEGAVKYNAGAAVGQLSASEVLAMDKINNPSTHSVILDPAKVTGTLTDSDVCEITLNGRLEQFKMYTPNNALGLDEVLQFTAIRKVVS